MSNNTTFERVAVTPEMIDRDGYIPIMLFTKQQEVAIGPHLFRNDGHGRMRCVFCGDGYIVIPAEPCACHWVPEEAIFAAMITEMRKAPFASKKDLVNAIAEILELVRLKETVKP